MQSALSTLHYDVILNMFTDLDRVTKFPISDHDPAIRTLANIQRVGQKRISIFGLEIEAVIWAHVEMENWLWGVVYGQELTSAGEGHTRHFTCNIEYM